MKIAAIYKLYSKHFLVDTDTRSIRKNTLFFALKGDNFNGNSFANEALKLGASYAVVDEKKHQTKANIILVDDVLKTLQELAQHHRNQLKIPIICLTGSNGKTTTKELIKIVLDKKYCTTATKGNLNNHIGVPLTLLSMTPKTEIGIVEMGANHQKEIAFLSAIAQPDYGYITNFGKAHLEGFGSLEGVIKGKCELYTFLEENAKMAFINTDDKIQTERSKNVKTIPFHQKLKYIDANPFVKLSFKTSEIQSNLIGDYNYANIAAAISIGHYFNVAKEQIKSAIEEYTPTNNRSQIIKTATNNIILDAYNANPSSMKAALENFASLKENAKTIILGDMFELGKESLFEHQAIVDLATKLKFKNTFFVGEHFLKANTKKKQFKNFEALKKHLLKNPLKQQSILIKGSRGMRLERVLALIE